MLALIDGGDGALEEARRLFAEHGDNAALGLPVGSAELLAPLPEPRQMRDGMSYETHIRQSGRGMRRLMAAGDSEAIAAIDAEPLAPLADIYRQLPIYYITNRLIVGGPGATVAWPRYSRVMDYELEYGIVVGKTAANISVEDARDHIFGYTIFNDFSARDQQGKEMPGWLGPAKGKSFDGANVLGPWIVTRDEIPDPYSLKAAVRVNGEVRCESTTAGMLFSFEQILAHMSQDETVHAGEFIGSGTIGNGCGLETGHFLEDGDIVELEIEKIGILKNKVVRQFA
ncbi:2-hydroxyhepta-2,4-diene-1,7-dioate isomerase [Rhizobium dioscoreae]|nr:2-hydroxyhepta-2,4-diene-1,7-dioate isomerase [Rhizobium dioscoreae]